MGVFCFLRMDNGYQGPERRTNSKTVLAKMVEEAVDHRVEQMEVKVMAHMDERFTELSNVFKAHVQDAFPNGDARGHREHHQSLIDSAEVAKRIRQDLIAWVIKGGIGLVLFLVGIGALEWLKRELSK